MSDKDIANQDELTFDEDDIGWGQGWGLWFMWIIANVVGWGLQNMVRQVIFEAGGSSVSQVSTGIAIGICLGFAQWFTLLTQPIKAGLWWVLTTIAGWGIGWTMGWWVGWTYFSNLGFGGVFAATGAIAGLSVGFWQWLILRGQLHSVQWWIVANGVGWGMGLMLSYSAALRSFGQLITGGIAGAVTGVVLIWLLRNPALET